MPEISHPTPGQLTKVTYQCDDCHQANLLFTGKVKLVNPPLYAHACSQCGSSIYVEGFKYPQLRPPVNPPA